MNSLRTSVRVSVINEYSKDLDKNIFGTLYIPAVIHVFKMKMKEGRQAKSNKKIYIRIIPLPRHNIVNMLWFSLPIILCINIYASY